MVHHNKKKLPQKKNRENKKKRKPKHPKAQTTHHILPSSRGGSDDDENKAMIIEYHHQKFHELFGNMTPYEIIAWLEIYFFNSQEHWVSDYSHYRVKFCQTETSLNKKEEAKKRKSAKCLKGQAVLFIVPISRGGKDVPGNRSIVIEHHKQKFHELFGDMTPYESLAWLETYFFNGQKHWIDDFSANRKGFLSRINK
jgi:hypothetical protein